ncbi:MAG: tetratricopeptide repeat protein [bacterium]|nr:tetratricopeptide repeat protein [bacterium]
MNNLVAERVKMRIPLTRVEKGTLVFKDSAGQIKATADVRFRFYFDYRKQAYGKLDSLLIMENIAGAVAFCENLKGKIRKECYLRLAQALFKEGLAALVAGNRNEAVKTFCVEKMKAVSQIKGSKRKRRQNLWNHDLQTYCNYITGEIYFEKQEYKQAIDYFGKTGLMESKNRLGEIHFAMGEYEKALGYFEKGYHSAARARNYGALADEYLKHEEKTRAKTFYAAAVAEYERMIKSFYYTWKPDDITHRQYCLEALERFEKTPREIADQKELKKLLAKTATYCSKLQHELIHFFCKEIIDETCRAANGRRVDNSLVYDYQLIKDKKNIKEQRIILKHNGLDTPKEESGLGTSKFKYQYLIYGPIAFFDKKVQRNFRYKIIGHETLFKKAAIIVEALPLRKSPQKDYCGKIWVDAEDYSIMKIDWHPKFIIENFADFLEKAERQNLGIEIDYCTEFKKQRNGLRFPSFYKINEYHIDEAGNKKRLASLKAEFNNYMFFSVGASVASESMGDE